MKKLIFVLILATIPNIIVSAFVNPLYDDYSYSGNILRVGFFESQINLYQGWAGRYFSNVLLSLNPITFGNFTAYKIVPIFIIFLTFASILALIDAFCQKNLNFGLKLIGAGIITVLFLNNMPDTLDGIYWIPGSVSYQLANILTLFLMVWLMKGLADPKRPKALFIVGSYLLIIAIVGSSETSMLFLLFIIGSMTITNFCLKSRNRWIWLGLFGLTMLCSAIVIASPGNEIRSSVFAGRHRLFYSLGMAIVQEGRFLAIWLSNPAFILTTIFSFPWLEKMVEKNELLKHHFYLHPLLSTALLILLLFGGFFPPYWATGMLGQYRSVNVAYFFFLIGWFTALALWISYFKRNYREIEVRLPKYVYLVGLPMLIISLFATNNSRAVIIDLIGGKASKYNQEMQQRSRQFEDCAYKDLTHCEINQIHTLPVTISNPNYFNPTSLAYEKNYWRLRILTENK